MDDAALLELPDDPTTLRGIILAERARHATVLKERDESIQFLSQDNQLLRNRLAALLRSSYGPRAERFDPRQLLLFGLLVPRIEFPAAGSTLKSKSPNRSRHGRQKLPEHLPRLPIEHDLDESERACPCCGQERQRIGQEKNEQLEHLSSNFVVLEHIRNKYACPHCNSGHCQKCDGHAHIDLAAKPQQPIEKGLAGPGLLAYVVTSKMADHLPLYRLEQIFARQRVNIDRSTLCGWIAAAARVVQPLMNCYATAFAKAPSCTRMTQPCRSSTKGTAGKDGCGRMSGTNTILILSTTSRQRARRKGRWDGWGNGGGSFRPTPTLAMTSCTREAM